MKFSLHQKFSEQAINFFPSTFNPLNLLALEESLYTLNTHEAVSKH